MNIKKVLAVPASIALAIPLMAGCPAQNQAAPKSLPDGTTQVTSNMYGFWHAPGGSSCRWWIQTKSGQIIDLGNRKQKPKFARMSQTMLLGTSKKNAYIKSDNCGPWLPGAA